MKIRDLQTDRAPGVWAGLRVEIEHQRSTRFRLEYANGGFLRICLERRPLLWARLWGGFDGFSWVRASDQHSSLLPPISMPQARETGDSPVQWARFLAPLLRDSGVIEQGQWDLSPVAPERANHAARTAATDRWHSVDGAAIREIGRTLEPTDGDTWDWDVDGGGWLLALRPMSSPDAARVKALRRAAREHCLPPIVIYWVAILDSWLLLDGHDRLQAAQLEGVRPRLLSVSRVRDLTVPPDAEEQARLYNHLEERFGGAGPLPWQTQTALNHALAMKFLPPRHAISKTRIWPLTGGRARWVEEVRHLLRESGDLTRLRVTEAQMLA